MGPPARCTALPCGRSLPVGGRVPVSLRFLETADGLQGPPAAVSVLLRGKRRLSDGDVERARLLHQYALHGASAQRLADLQYAHLPVQRTTLYELTKLTDERNLAERQSVLLGILDSQGPVLEGDRLLRSCLFCGGRHLPVTTRHGVKFVDAKFAIVAHVHSPVGFGEDYSSSRWQQDYAISRRCYVICRTVRPPDPHL
jgi:hypothetical protein